MQSELEKKWKHRLIDEGFSNVFTVIDGPDGVYGKHSHPRFTIHVILEGEMSVTMDDKITVYKAGDHFELPPSTDHSAQMGPAGCTYLVGEK